MYSGNFLAEAEVEPFGTTRLRIGIHPEAFAWRLEPGASFTTPEAVIAWSGEGLGALSEAFHGLYRERLARGPWRDRARPVLLNNWEATYFDFDHDRIVAIASKARDLGVELFVLDDGWFGRRDKDNSSLGDWVVDRRKLPGGLDALARDVHGLGLKFGLWIEPEMVNPDSDLFRAHPDWAIGVPGRPRTESRQQLVLDFARPEVVDHLADALIAVLASAPIDYIKWDMNRNITEPWTASVPAERQGEFFHRYILGVYDLYRRLIERFPDILFESCASGGGRFDAGLLAFAPQAWTSDDTDAVERLPIQWGTSLAYPLLVHGGPCLGGAEPPDGARSRRCSRAPRWRCSAPSGMSSTRPRCRPTSRPRSSARSRGISSGATCSSSGASCGCAARSRATATRRPGWPSTRPLPTRSSASTACWRMPMPARDRLRLRGLDPAATYRVTTWLDTFEAPAATADRAGDELMAVGLGIEPPDMPLARGEASDGTRIVRGDYQARLFELRRI